MNILMTSYHTAYIYMLSKLGYNIFVLKSPNFPFIWDTRNRPLPNNVHLIDSADSITQFANAGNFIDLILMQDLIIPGKDGNPDFADRIYYENYKCKKIMLFHNSFFTQFRTQPKEQYDNIRMFMNNRLQGIKKVFISEFKKKSWGMEGDIIKPGIDLNEFGGWNGEHNGVLTCCNNFKHRDFMNNYNKSLMACVDLPYSVYGDNEGKSQVPPDFEHFKVGLRQHRYYLCLNNPEFEDGYNLSMLEFMASGGVALTLNHFSSPIISGVNGFKSDSLGELNQFMHTAKYEDLVKMGRKARETIDKEFNMDDFIDNWMDVIEND